MISSVSQLKLELELAEVQDNLHFLAENNLGIVSTLNQDGYVEYVVTYRGDPLYSLCHETINEAISYARIQFGAKNGY